jgi:hypothetical protein
LLVSFITNFTSSFSWNRRPNSTISAFPSFQIFGIFCHSNPQVYMQARCFI